MAIGRCQEIDSTNLPAENRLDSNHREENTQGAYRERDEHTQQSFPRRILSDYWCNASRNSAQDHHEYSAYQLRDISKYVHTIPLSLRNPICYQRGEEKDPYSVIIVPPFFLAHQCQNYSANVYNSSRKYHHGDKEKDHFGESCSVARRYLAFLCHHLYKGDENHEKCNCS